MDFIDDLLNQMSSAFNQETAIPKKEEISMDETLKWRALKNNQFASRTRLPQQQQQQQQAGSGGSGTRSGQTNGRKSAGATSGGGSGTASGSTARRERRRTVGGTGSNSSNDSGSSNVAVDEGSRSPAALLGDNGCLTPPETANGGGEDGGEDEEDNIEIEIAKDISGEELQEALGLSQLIEVDSAEDFAGGGAMEVDEDRLEPSDDSLLPGGDRKSSPPALAKLGTEKEEEEEVVDGIVQEDCKPEDEMDTKSSLLEVPYCSSASVSPSMGLAQGKDSAGDQQQQQLKRDTDETDAPDVPMETNELELETKSSNTLEGDTAAVEGDGTGRVSVAESASKQEPALEEGSEKGEPTDGASSAAEGNDEQDHVAVAELDDASTLEDDEDDVLIINTDEMDEVVELAETSKEDEEDDEDGMSDGKIAAEQSNTDDRAKTASPPKDNDASTAVVSSEKPDEKQPEPEPLVVVAIPTENVTESEEEKFNPQEEAAGALQGDKLSHDDQSAGDFGEVKYSDALKSSISGSPTKADDEARSDEKLVESKTDEAMAAEDRKPAEHEAHSDAGSANTSTEDGADKTKQPAGRTTRSKKGAAVVATVATAVASATSTTLSQRRSQRFQKESAWAVGDGKPNGDVASEPSTIVVKEEEVDDGAAAKKRASVGPASEARVKGTLKSDRSLRSKQQGNAGTLPAQSTVMTRRASETVKLAADEANESLDAVETGTDKSIVGRRGRKRLSQERSVPAAVSVVSNEPPVIRAREKSGRDEPAKVVEAAEQRRASRSGFPAEPEESDAGGKVTVAAIPAQQEKSTPQQQVPQRRGRKRKNPSTAEATPPTATSTPSGPGAASADKAPLHPYKRAARVSRDGSDGILASALARRDKVDSQGRLSRPIKLSAKILANEELRQGFEQHNNGRIIIGSEQSSPAVVVHEDELVVEPEKQRKPADALGTTVASTDDTDQWQIINTSEANCAGAGDDGDDGEGGGGGGDGAGGTLEAATHSDLPMTDATNETTTVTTNEADEESSDSISHSVETKPNPLPSVPVLGHSPSAGSTVGPAITRCRSDSYLLAECRVPSRPEPTNDRQTAALRAATVSSDAIPTSSHPANHTGTTHGMCFRCGKRRNGIRRKLKKFRKQLDAATVSEVEKRRKLEAFLNYLERRSKGSFDLTDSESITEEASVSMGDEAAGEGAASGSRTGAHGVQAGQSNPKPPEDLPLCTNLYSSGNLDLVNMKQIKLSDIKESADLDVLSVKQLKGILMVNRVDFKGCCEKAELKERVLRLWRDYKSIPSIEKLPSDDLCKICMDAPIECVILECGHMTTCTACGKVLSECPICRQYIVRVVRFFRA